MVDALPIDLTRDLLGEFIPNPRTIRAFENININNEALIEIVTDIQETPLIAVTLSPVLTNDRFLNPGADVTFTDGGAKGPLTFGLTNTGVAAATYGSPTQIVQFAVDAKGRITLASNITLNSDNVAEGVVNLYFTEARARAALSGGTGISYSSGTGVIALDTGSTRNTDHAAVTMTAGAGLTGGGDTTASRTFNIGAGSGIVVNADDIQIDTAVVATISGVQTLTNKTLTEPVVSSSTVAGLPAAGVAGRKSFVTDATATTFASIVAGGGANSVPVYDDGANWRIG